MPQTNRLRKLGPTACKISKKHPYMVLKQVFSREPGICGLQNFEEIRIGDLKQVFSREPGICGLQNFEEIRIGDLKQVFSREPGICGLQNFEECSILGPFSFSSLAASGTSPKSQSRLNLPFPGPMYKRSNFLLSFHVFSNVYWGYTPQQLPRI